MRGGEQAGDLRGRQVDRPGAKTRADEITAKTASPGSSTITAEDTAAGQEALAKRVEEYAAHRTDGTAAREGLFDPFTARLLALETKREDGGRVLDQPQASLTMESFFVGTPGPIDAPRIDDKGGVSSDVLGHGASGAYGHALDTSGDGQVDLNAKGSATVDRAGLKLGLDATADGATTSAYVFAKKGFTSVGGGRTWATADGGAHTLGGFVGGSKSVLAVGVNGGRTGASGITGTLGAVGVARVDRGVADLGVYQGPDEALWSKRKIEVSKQLGGTGVGSVGGLASGAANAVSSTLGAAIGIGGRLAPTKGKQVIYRTHVDEAKAQALVHEGSGVVQLARDKARALGLAEDPVKIPSLDEPERMAVGDELVVSTSGGISGGLALGALGLQAGVQGTVHGEFEIAARRLDESRFELVVTPSRVRGVGVSAHAPFVLEVGSSKTAARALTQAFVFDFAHPSAREAWQKALKGELPNGLGKAGAGERVHDDGIGLAAMVQDEKLPPGVGRTYLEQFDVRSTRHGGGLNWGVVQTGWGLAGLSGHSATLDEQRLVTDGKVIVKTDTRGVERRKEVLLSGVETCGVFGSIRRTTTFDDHGKPVRGFGGVNLEARFTDDAVRGLELNKDMIERINEAFGIELKPFSVKGHGQGREILVQRTLGEEELNQLGALAPGIARRLAEKAGVAPKALQDLVSEVGGLAEHHEKAEAVQRFIQDTGLAGLGALHRATGGGRESLDVQTSSTLYTDPIGRAERLELQHRTPISPDEDASALLTRFKAVEANVEDIHRGVVESADDGLLTEAQKAAITDQLLEARARTLELMKVDHLTETERQGLADKVGWGWTSGAKRRLKSLLLTGQWPSS